MRFGRRQVVDADVRIYVQEVRAVHTAAGDGGMRAAVRLPEMPRACPPCPPDRTRLPHHVGRSASGRRKVRAHHRRIARPAAILARSWMGQEGEGETCQGESVSASLTDLASRDPANFPQADPVFSVKSMAPVAAGNARAGTLGRRDDASESDGPISSRYFQVAIGRTYTAAGKAVWTLGQTGVVDPADPSRRGPVVLSSASLAKIERRE